MQSNNQSSVPKIVGAIVAILVCCSCVLILGAGAVIYRSVQEVPDLSSLMTPMFDPVTPQPTPELVRPPVDEAVDTTLETLEQTNVPENDPYEMACRLRGLCDVSRTVQAKQYQVGDREKFWILNSDNVEHRQGDFTLVYITPHSYFWVEDGSEYRESDVKRLMDTFENEIYPTNREFFGSEANPGIDNDPHIFVLYAGGLGRNVGGYFNSSDGYHPQINEYSNAHETYVMLNTQPLDDEYAYATLAHEFVHMIQDAYDRNDATWMTEGFAEVGALLNGYAAGSSEWAYVQDPDLQLNSWADNSSPDFGRHYGQSFLYLAYFLDRFGEEATKALTNNPENDLPSVDDTLAQLNITDPQTGEVITADDVFMDWAATLYLMDENVGDGRYTYHNYPEAPQYFPDAEEIISNCPQSFSSNVNQYGVDYYTIDCAGDFTLSFTGSTVTSLLPVNPNSGSHAFWSNKGNESNMTLTQEFDFSGVNGPIEISYWTWYDIEKDWDYLHVAASTDGQTWQLLTTPSGTDYNPTGASFGWSYTGQSSGWIQEQVDLSQFAGQKFQLRFEYITDAAVNGEGFLLDDIRIDAIGYETDFENNDGGWKAEGFARIENVLPQTYRLSLITKGDTTTVTHIPLDSDQTASIPLSLQEGEEAVLIVTGTTRFTTHPTAYQVEIK
jgi:hypothetical protein